VCTVGSRCTVQTNATQRSDCAYARCTGGKDAALCLLDDLPIEPQPLLLEIHVLTVETTKPNGMDDPTRPSISSGICGCEQRTCTSHGTLLCPLSYPISL
jgi:hypothetical protein